MADASVLTARQPLGEAPNRINTQHAAQQHDRKMQDYRPDASRPRVHHHHHHHHPGQDQNCPPGAPAPRAVDESRRLSQASYESTSSRSSKNYKTHIGPWQLGRTLGKGSSARVRLCRHNITNQLAAVKIVNRRMAYLVQDSSLAALSKHDLSQPEVNGEMRVPMAIEREVAILKLIEHPNIMKLYDIWENRSEIYLILEYIDQGDLFTFINSKGRLSEEIAIYFFRQIISAIAYCHSFNVCHRDLKPENILITADLQIKIADFGMAALHQTDSHRLVTACGSPHYAAPELLKNKHYRGDRADIWSLGVILFAMLSATLPFDDPDLRIMMSKTKRGQYEMPKLISPEAEDLIRRMLQVNPDRRITLKEIWGHPLIQKYGYLDDFGDLSGQLPDTSLKGFRYTPILRHEIDPQLLRQLQSMWHMFSEQELAGKISNPEPNDQKAFYWLLHNYREKQLEDFKPELSHSMSDYHHLKPNIWKKRVSTCQFAQPRDNGHGRSISRFTVISNAAETEVGTVNSYDPYRGSRMLKTSHSRVSHARITVHRDVPPGAVGQAMRSRRHSSYSTTRRSRINSARTLSMGRSQMSGSLASFRSGRPGTHRAHGPMLRHKRGVDFSHVRKRPDSAASQNSGSRRSLNAMAGHSRRERERPTRSITPEMPPLPSGPLAKGTGPSIVEEISRLFNEELRHFSHNIAKDCDKAFKTSLVEDDSQSGSMQGDDTTSRYRASTPFSFAASTPSDGTVPTEVSNKSWSSRPLPPLPLDNEGPISRHSNHGPLSTMALKQQVDRRVVSAPAHTHGSRRPSALPSILENGGAPEKPRIVSAPPAYVRSANARNGAIECLSRVPNSIRMVDSPLAERPVEMPEPLNVRKKVPREDVAHAAPPQSKICDAGDGGVEAGQPTDPEPTRHSSSRKKPWFRLSFKGGEDSVGVNPSRAALRQTHQSSSDVTSDGAKKRHFSFSFWKSNRDRDRESMMMMEDQGQVVVPRRLQKRVLEKSSSSGSRSIAVKQNWLARLFRVKPATGYICLTLSRRRARQEVVALLKEWQQHGIEGIQVDKERNIVFARIGAENVLNLKKVAFAAEIIRVIEHGKKQPLSIVRFTQERGAASTFERVVNTMRMVFASRNQLVVEKSKQRMMIKTLNS